MIGMQFITAGKAIFTVKFSEAASRKTGVSHYTFKAKKAKNLSKTGEQLYFVSLLTGSDNENDYTYIGVIGDNGFRMTPKSGMPVSSLPIETITKVISRLMNNEGHVIQAAGFDVLHEGQCGRCGKMLTTPTSIETGFGPECVKKMKLECVAV